VADTLTIGGLITAQRAMNNKQTMQNKEVSRVFQPYQAMDLIQNAKLIEKT
jgi:hypothetical protein